MSEALQPIQIKKCRKNHVCWWCGEQIVKGSPYVKWAWVDGTIETVKAHPECKDAWNDAADEEGGYYETMPYEHARGSYNEK